MHSCKSDIGLQLEPVYYHSTASWYQHTAGFSLDSSKRSETEKIQTLTLIGSRSSKNGTVCSICLLICSPIWSWLVRCSTNESGWDSLLAQPMLPSETPCLLGQCFRPRLFAWFGSRRVSRSAALLPGTTVTLAPSTTVALFCWLTWVAWSRHCSLACHNHHNHRTPFDLVIKWCSANHSNLEYFAMDSQLHDCIYTENFAVCVGKKSTRALSLVLVI